MTKTKAELVNKADEAAEKWLCSEEGVKYTDCDLCHNKGYTAHEYKPKTKTEIIGYE